MSEEMEAAAEREFGIYQAEIDRLHDQLDKAIADLAPIAAERDKAYGERADLVAYLAACYPSVIEDDQSDWPCIFVITPSGQLSWHIARPDLGAFPFVQRAFSVTWDGHTTAEKYRRLAELTRTVATGVHGPQPTADLPADGFGPAPELERQ